MTLYLGLDPGLGGAISLLRPDAQLLNLIDMPTLHVTKSRRILDEREIVYQLKAARDFTPGGVRAVLERAMVMPKQGSASGFKIGIGYGQLLGILAALEIPTMLVVPQKWQAAILGKCAPGTSKDKAREFAGRMWPTADLGKRKSQDRADALCLALFGIRHWAATPAAESGDVAA